MSINEFIERRSINMQDAKNIQNSVGESDQSESLIK